jgi:hypothetical protein
MAYNLKRMTSVLGAGKLAQALQRIWGELLKMLKL